MVFDIYSIHYIQMISRFHFDGKHVRSYGTTEWECVVETDILTWQEDIFQH